MKTIIAILALGLSTTVFAQVDTTRGLKEGVNYHRKKSTLKPVNPRDTTRVRQAPADTQTRTRPRSKF